MLAVINFHYIRELHQYPAQGIHGLVPEKLKAQLQALGRVFDFVKPSDLPLWSRSSALPAGTYCLITFDDGLREQVETGKPVLDELGIEALYFVNGRCIEEKTVNSVHKLHWIRAQMADMDFFHCVMNLLEELKIAVPIRYEAFTPVEGQNIYDSNEMRYIKYLLNHALDKEEQALLLDRMFRHVLAVDEKAHASRLYMSKGMVRRLMSSSQIGSHGYEHDAKTLLSRERLNNDFRMNQDWLHGVGGSRCPCISYPYGGRKAVSSDVATAAKQAGHSLGFTMERALNLSLAQPLLMGRLDTNEAFLGKNQSITCSGGRLGASAPVSVGREWFFESGENLRPGGAHAAAPDTGFETGPNGRISGVSRPLS